MMKFIVLFLLLISLPSISLADECGLCSERSKVTANGEKSLRDIVEKINGTLLDESPAFYDSFFLHNATRSKTDASIKIDSVSAYGMFKSNYEDAVKFSLLYFAVSGREIFIPDDQRELFAPEFLEMMKEFPVARSFSDATRLLEKVSPQLSTDQKLLLLSTIGSDLNKRYDTTLPGGSLSYEAIFQNNVRSGSKGGVCRHIHDYLGALARTMGLEPVLQTGNWGHSNKTGAHVWLTLKDPKTGTFYLQNYSQIIKTDAKNEQEIAELSARLLAPLSNITILQTRPDRNHVMQPATARWIRNFIEGKAFTAPENYKMSVRAGSDEFTGSFEVGKASKGGNFLKAFALHSMTSTSAEGDYSVGIIGVSGNLTGKKEFENKIVKEVGYAANLHGGILQLTNADFLDASSHIANSQTFKYQRRDNAFLGLSLKGTAKINSVNGEIEFKGSEDDMGFSLQQMAGPLATGKLRASYATGKVTIGAERRLEGTLATVSDLKPTVQTAYDKIDVVVDTRSERQKAYFVYKGEIYLFEGAQQMSATGLKQTLAASKNFQKFGNLTVIGDYSKILTNKSKDTFYDYPNSFGIKARLQKDLGKFGSLNFEGEKRNRNPFYYFIDMTGSQPFATPQAGKNTRATVYWTKSLK